MSLLVEDFAKVPINNLKETIKSAVKAPMGRKINMNFTRITRTGRPIREDPKEMPENLKKLLPFGLTTDSIFNNNSKENKCNFFF